VLAGEYVSSIIYHAFNDKTTSHPLKDQMKEPRAGTP
jgi:hypothetical protein